MHLPRFMRRVNRLFTNPLLEMGLILNKAGRLHEAEAYLRQALDIRTRLLPKGNLGIGKAEGALGECLTMQTSRQLMVTAKEAPSGFEPLYEALQASA